MRSRVMTYWLVVVLTAMSGCGEVDNYAAPDATLYGRVVDSNGVAVPQRVAGSTGLKLSLYDQQEGYTLPIQFYAKSDGSFHNSMLFAGRYKVVLDQTNFYPVEPFLVDLPRGETEKNIPVVPFCEIRDVEVTHMGETRVKVGFRLARDRSEGCKIVQCAVYGFVSPNVDDLAVNHNVSATITPPLGGSQLFDGAARVELEVDMADDKDFTQKYAHIVRANGNRIYVRVAVMTSYDDGLNDRSDPKIYINFSTVFPVRIDLD